MDAVSIHIDSSKLDKKLLSLASKLRDAGPMLEEIGMVGEQSVKRNFAVGGRPNKWRGIKIRNGRPLQDTGNLRGSIAHEIQGKAVLIGTNHISAPLHHFGGTVTPKNVKAIPVPLNAAAAKAQKNVKSVRQIPDLALVPRKGKQPLLVKFKGRKTKSGAYSMKGASLEPWFVLVKAVRIPARPFLLLQPQDFRRFNSILKKYVEVADVQ